MATAPVSAGWTRMGSADVFDLGGQGRRAGDAEQIVQALLLTEVHQLGPAIVTVPADRQAGWASGCGCGR